MMVFEKHYYRAGNRLTLTVIINNLEDITRVHYISGGGGQGLFTFDWDFIYKCFEMEEREFQY